MLARIVLITILLSAAGTALSAASYYPQGYGDANPDFAAVGKVERIDYRYQDFGLVGDRETYSIFADHARIQLPNGRFGTIRDIQNGYYVRIKGERLSERSARAFAVIVLEDTDRFEPEDRHYSSTGTDVRGVVTRVQPLDKEIMLRAHDADYIVVVRANTRITRYLYASDITDIAEGDEISVTGTTTGLNRIYANRIQVLSTGRYDRRRERDRDRQDTIEGVITYPPAIFDRTFAIETAFGERKVDVVREAEVTRGGRDISVHDLKKGDYVRACGTWDGKTLVAGIVDVIDRDQPPESLPPPEPPADLDPAPAPPAAPEPAPEVEEPSPAQPPAEQPAPEEPAPASVRTGRIVAIDHEKFTMALDVDMTDVKVDAQNAAVTRKGSTRRFSDLNVGDKVTVMGEIVDGVVKATAVEIAE